MTKRNHKYQLLAAMLLAGAQAFGQHSARYEQFFQDPSIVNPGAINIMERGSASFFYNRQMVSVKGAPENLLVNVALPVAEKHAGFGVFFGQEKVGINTLLNGYVSYCYTIPFNKSKLHAGGSIGLINQRFNTSAAIYTDLDDPTILALSDAARASKVDLRAGAVFEAGNLWLGASVKRVMSPVFNFQYYKYYGETKLFLVSQFSGGYRADMGNGWSFRPAVNAAVTRDIPGFVQLSANFNYNDRFWAGATVVNNRYAGGNIGVSFNDLFRIGYSVSYPINKNTSLVGANHEAYVSVYLSGFKPQTPKIPPVQVQRDTIYIERVDYGKPAPKPQPQRMKMNNDTITIAKLDDIRVIKTDTDTAKIKFADVKGAKPDPGYYVVVGTYKLQENADKQMKIMFSRNVKCFKFYSESNGFYYVYVFRSDDLDEAEEVKQTGDYDVSDIWIKRVGK